MKFNWNPEIIPKILKLNNTPAEGSVSPELLKAKKNILLQAGLAFLTIVLTIVILFAMTSAWYTNIVQTSGLIFEVESWGFGGEIEIDETPILAGPGDSGIIGVKMDGGNQDILEVSVNVSKEQMSEQMKKRMFFYVDSPKIINGENVGRIYINNHEDYTYTLFSNGSINISEDFSNVPELKWQWVYDVLGYYVLADYNETDGTMDIKDYLRPIEYDFDNATFTMVQTTVESGGESAVFENKIIETIDGKPPEVFLAEFSANDGYAEEIGSEDAVLTSDGKTYYKVDEGIYAYLCSYSEVEEATLRDTELGKLAFEKAKGDTTNQDKWDSLRFIARLSVSVQNREQAEAVAVSDAEALNEALNGSEDFIRIKLEDNIETGSHVKIPNGKTAEIDLNGYTVTVPKGSYGFALSEGADLTLLNGKVEATETGVGAFFAKGASITLSGIDTENFDYGFYIADDIAGGIDSTVRIYDSEIEGNKHGILVLGNGEASEQKTQVIIEKTHVYGELSAITGNGSDGKDGTDIKIISSTVESADKYGSTAIYQPQKDSILTVYNSTVSGGNGITIKGGTVNVIDSDIIGNLSGEEIDEPGYSNSGAKSTGDAIYIEDNYKYPIRLMIRNSEGKYISSVKGQAVRVFAENSPYATVEIISGSFSPAITDENWIAEGSQAKTEDNLTKITKSDSAEENPEQ